MSKQKTEYISNVLKILGGTTRLQIIEKLLSRDEHISCVKEIAESIGKSHSATSHQLALLERSAIVKSVRCGQTICYELTASPLTRVLKTIIEECHTLKS